MVPPPPIGHKKINLLRQSQINPRMSEEAQINGAFNYNQNPMAPPGTKILIPETPEQRRTWDFHCKGGWYICTPPLHYRCYHIYVTYTWGKITPETVEFTPHNGAMPAMYSSNAATDAARCLANALANPAPPALFAHFGSQTMAAI